METNEREIYIKQRKKTLKTPFNMKMTNLFLACAVAVTDFVVSSG